MSSFSNPKINPIHAYFLCMCAIFSLGQISGAIILLEEAKRDAFVSSIIGSIAFILYAFWLYRIVNNLAPNRSFLSEIELKMGKLIAWAVRCWIALYLFCELFVIHKNIVTWVKSMILPFTPVWAISLPLLAVCAYLAVKGIKPIAITLSVLLPALLMLFLFMAVFTLKYRHYDLLLPLFSEGTQPILEGAATTFRAGMEFFILLLISPYIQGRFKWRHFVAVLSIIFVYIVNNVASMLTTYGPYEASKQRFPVYTLWRIVNISNYVEHLDFLSIYQWLTNASILISLGLFIVGDLLTSKKLYKKIAILAFTAALFFGVELQFNDSDF